MMENNTAAATPKLGPSRPEKYSFNPVLQRYQRLKPVAPVPLDDKVQRPDLIKTPKVFHRRKVGLSEWNDVSFTMAKFMGSTTNSFDVSFKPKVSNKDWHPERPAKHSARIPVPGGFNTAEMANVGPFEYTEGSRTRWPRPYAKRRPHYDSHVNRPNHGDRKGKPIGSGTQLMTNGIWQQFDESQLAVPKETESNFGGQLFLSRDATPDRSAVQLTSQQHKRKARKGGSGCVRQPTTAVLYCRTARSPRNKVVGPKTHRVPVAKMWHKRRGHAHAAKRNAWTQASCPQTKTRADYDAVFEAREVDSTIHQLDEFETQLHATYLSPGKATDFDQKASTFPDAQDPRFPASALSASIAH